MSTGPYSRCIVEIKTGFCGGEVTWERFPDRWRGTCSRCGDQRKATTLESRRLEQHAAQSSE